ncbi:MAG: hypothetical protein PHY47_14525 [Lachnospiraceae bacterium]|nr:hypothetical protein [Lachnospiraceae bacterium]
MKILNTEKKLCTCCMEEHEVKQVCVVEHVTFKNVPVQYEASYYYCDLAEELYMDDDQISENDVRMKDAYRTALNITLRRSRLSGVAKATFPDKQSHLVATLFE